ncbi:MAG: PLP-dependent transferase [Pirellulaceae bacterium]
MLGRGLKTLDLRIREQSRGYEIAQFLEGHAGVKSVLYQDSPRTPSRQPV